MTDSTEKEQGAASQEQEAGGKAPDFPLPRQPPSCESRGRGVKVTKRGHAFLSYRLLILAEFNWSGHQKEIA